MRSEVKSIKLEHFHLLKIMQNTSLKITTDMIGMMLMGLVNSAKKKAGSGCKVVN